MKFAMRYRDRRSENRMLARCEILKLIHGKLTGLQGTSETRRGAIVDVGW